MKTMMSVLGTLMMFAALAAAADSPCPGASCTKKEECTKQTEKKCPQESECKNPENCPLKK